jgi:hypothetical protein
MFGHGAFDISHSFRNEGYENCYKPDAPAEVKACYEIVSNYNTVEEIMSGYCKCNENPDWHKTNPDAGWSPSTENSTSYDNSNGNGDADEGEDEELQCDSADCPPNHVATKKTDANGKESCECVDAQAVGDGIKAIGTGLALLAVGGVVTTGLIGYAIYRIIRG